MLPQLGNGYDAEGESCCTRLRRAIATRATIGVCHAYDVMRDRDVQW